MTPKKTAIAIIKSSFGDDLERAEKAFHALTQEQLQEQYGESGQTRQQLLDGYRRDRADRQAALEWAVKAEVKESKP